MRDNLVSCLGGTIPVDTHPSFQVIVEDERLINDDNSIHQLMRGSRDSAGYDLTVWPKEPVLLEPGDDAVLLPCGIRLWINRTDVVGLIFPRSGTGHKRGLVLGNGTGVIDPDYQGPLGVSLVNRSNKPEVVNPGDRVAQIVFMPFVKVYGGFAITNEFTAQTERSGGGFGSTGR